MADHLELTRTQQEKLDDIESFLQSTPADDVQPTDLIDTWKPAPETQGRDWEKSERWVFTKDIVGTIPMNTDRLKPARMLKHIERIKHNEFELQHPLSPSLKQVDGDLYVDADGNHRVLLMKAIGVKKIWAEVVQYY